MSKYQYGVEYQHKGHHPVELPHGVNIELYCVDDGKWYPSKSSDRTVWSDWDAFRIVDERYKPEQDSIHQPQHYAFFDGTEAIEVISASMTQEQFRGYCMGNKLKYCLRAGKKGDALEDLAKADKYDELYHKYVHLCRE